MIVGAYASSLALLAIYVSWSKAAVADIDYLEILRDQSPSEVPSTLTTSELTTTLTSTLVVATVTVVPGQKTGVPAAAAADGGSNGYVENVNGLAQDSAADVRRTTSVAVQAAAAAATTTGMAVVPISQVAAGEAVGEEAFAAAGNGITTGFTTGFTTAFTTGFTTGFFMAPNDAFFRSVQMNLGSMIPLAQAPVYTGSLVVPGNVTQVSSMFFFWSCRY